MRRIISLGLLAATLVISRGAMAQDATVSSGGARGLGAGFAAMLTDVLGAGSLAGPSIAFDAGVWHLDAMLSFSKVEGSRANFGLGGRGWFKLHRTASSDFSVGGGLGFIHLGPPDDDLVILEGGGQLRAFIAGNVALSLALGLGVLVGDRTFVELTAQPFLVAGAHYYFF